jgi:hypothetical protein
MHAGSRVLALALLACLVFAPRTGAAPYPGFAPLVTDPMAVFAIPDLARPPYLMKVADPTFGSAIVAITGEPGADVGLLGPEWSATARHVYSKQAAWNSASLMLSLSNTNKHPNPVILNGTTYQPMFEPCYAFDHFDWRWHPLTEHRNVQINVNREGTMLSWWNVVTCTEMRSWTLPIVADYGIGMGEGNPTNDGRFVAIGNQQQMVVVDMDPRPPHAPYPNIRIGPVFTFDPCSLDVTRPDSGRISHLSISPSGRYVTVKYRGLALVGQSSCDTLCDMRRVFEVDTTTLAIKVHNMADASLRCGSFASRPNGWIFPLKHADLALDPFDGDEDVIIGGRACPGSTLGRIVKVRLSDGQLTPLTNPVNEASYNHGSARNILRPGWFYASYSRDPSQQGKRFWGEIVAVKIDGSGEVQRFAHHHSTQQTFLSEAHPVPSPDGKRILVASDWLDHCAENCGQPGVVGAYVIDGRENALLDAPAVKPPGGLALALASPNPTRAGLVVRVGLPAKRPAALELYDITGRRLALRNVGLLGAGEHAVDLDPGRMLPSGVYLLSLTDGRATRTTKAVVLR